MNHQRACRGKLLTKLVDEAHTNTGKEQLTHKTIYLLFTFLFTVDIRIN